MNVLVCGGRNFSDAKFVNFVLDALHKRHAITRIIHGCAQGADTFAEKWASQVVGCTAYGVPAEWKKHGDRAGPIRNRVMLDLGQPDLVVAFSGGAGTRDMTAAAVAAGVRVLFAEKLRHHFEPQTLAQRVKVEAKTTRMGNRALKSAPRTTGGEFRPSCQCEVLPWEPCEHSAV